MAFHYGLLMLILSMTSKNLRRESTDVSQKRKGIATSVTRTNNRATSTPAAVMGSTPEQLDKLYDTLMIRLHQEKDKFTLRVVS